MILGAWGALIPFIGPRFDFAYTPGQAWTAARGWLEVLPGVAAAVGGLLLIISGNRAIAMLGGWLSALAGAWFVVGTQFAPLLRIGSVGDPVAVTDRKRAVLELAYFSGLGVLIVFLAGAVLSRLAVRLARDVRPAPVTAPAEEPVAAADAPAAGRRRNHIRTQGIPMPSPCRGHKKCRRRAAKPQAPSTAAGSCAVTVPACKPAWKADSDPTQIRLRGARASADH
ncbi:hypothetical protein BZL29_7550 [Mycobacterium kansasii]|uniref:Uncharacterized protein n=1 Tax=Mycobacterium kansasii TaxID=1768 RepID=A0A1V3WIG1_MYCKA|nr:hypothetical protein BZL29_7550 [Mycobacterium kansasii]